MVFVSALILIDQVILDPVIVYPVIVHPVIVVTMIVDPVIVDPVIVDPVTGVFLCLRFRFCFLSVCSLFMQMKILHLKVTGM